MNEAASPPHKPSFWSVFVDILPVIFEHKVALLKALAIPFAVYTIIDVVEYFIDPADWFYYAVLPVAAVTYAWYAIAIHRIILIGGDAVPEWGYVGHLTRREFQFLKYVLVFVLAIMALEFLPAGYALFSFKMLVAFAFLYLILRLVLVFPAVAVDDDPTLGDIWHLTQGNVLFMLGIVFLLPLLYSGLPAYFFSHVWPNDLALSILASITMVFEITALSLAYEEVTRYDAARDWPM